ncbi:MAG: hypothetical protein ACFFCP_06125 [Promethearchaeota archaeon]
MEEDDKDLETAFKVVAIMQTITEDLDERGRRAWRKMLGQEEDTRDNETENEMTSDPETKPHPEEESDA